MHPSVAKQCVWLIGNKGMLGTELALILKNAGVFFVETDREVDITNRAALTDFVEQQKNCGSSIAWIINCAAYTAVDKAEDDIETCRRLNALGAGNIAVCANSIGARLIHISTDYVFDGKGIVAGTSGLRPYREDDATNPIGVYGLTKRDGELAVIQNNPRSYIIRTAWLYGKHGNNFVATMLRLMNERDEVKVVNDQRGSPTWAFDLANLLCEIIRAEGWGRKIPYGIYHYTNRGAITWFDFALEIYTQGRSLGLIDRDCAIKSCTSAEYPARVKRPAWSVLDKAKIETALGLAIPGWDESLIRYLRLTAEDRGLRKNKPVFDVRWKQRFEKMEFGLSDTTLKTLRAFFEECDGIQKVILYGSRAMGTYRSGSDIDITLISDETFTFKDLMALKSKLDDSSLPYLFDVSIFGRLNNANLVDHINRQGKILYEKQYAAV